MRFYPNTFLGETTAQEEQLVKEFKKTNNEEYNELDNKKITITFEQELLSEVLDFEIKKIVNRLPYFGLISFEFR